MVKNKQGPSHRRFHGSGNPRGGEDGESQKFVQRIEFHYVRLSGWEKKLVDGWYGKTVGGFRGLMVSRATVSDLFRGTTLGRVSVNEAWLRGRKGKGKGRLEKACDDWAGRGCDNLVGIKRKSSRRHCWLMPSGSYPACACV